jgi:hypothetical protein
MVDKKILTNPYRKISIKNSISGKMPVVGYGIIFEKVFKMPLA